MERFVTRSDSCAASPWSSPEAALHAYFGYSEFRPPQKQVIQHIFNGKSAIVLMPTGGKREERSSSWVVLVFFVREDFKLEFKKNTGKR